MEGAVDRLIASPEEVSTNAFAPDLASRYNILLLLSSLGSIRDSLILQKQSMGRMESSETSNVLMAQYGFVLAVRFLKAAC